MALSPVPSTNLNTGAWFGKWAATEAFAGGGKGLDKREVKEWQAGSVFSQIAIGKSIVDETANVLGLRSPYFTIGEIAGDFNTWVGRRISDVTGGLVRAVSNQEGVIIDCLGDMDGTWAVEFTQNPIFYGSSTATDSRIRKPAELTAVVAISNYNCDNGIQGTLSTAAQTYAGTLGNSVANSILYQGNTRAQQGLYKLIWLMENGAPFTVYTPHGIYESMLIENIKVKTDDKTMEMLYATLAFKEIIMTRPYSTDGTGVEMPARKNIVATKGGLGSTLERQITKWGL